MAEMMQFDLVSPERRLASISATEVQIPGADGDMTAMEGHAPTITTLRPGLLRVVHAGGTDEYLVSGGFAEITAGSLSVLAEQALPRSEVTQDIYNAMVASARDVQKAAEGGDGADAAAKLVADLLAVGGQIGMGQA